MKTALGLIALLALAGCSSAPPAPHTPDACVEALSLADEGFVIVGDTLSVQAEAWQSLPHVAFLDRIAVNNARMDGLSPRYAEAKAACLATR